MSCCSPPSKANGWTRFPVNELLMDVRVQRLLPKLLWLVVPLQYYYTTHISGGFNPESYIPSAALVVLFVTSMVVVGGAVAIIYPRPGRYFDRARGMITPMLGTWGLALTMVSMSYLLSPWAASTRPRDVVLEYLCPTDGTVRFTQPLCDAKGGQAASYVLYALVSAVLLSLLVRLLAKITAGAHKRDEFEPISEPNIVVVALAVGIVMTVIHTVITS